MRLHKLGRVMCFHGSLIRETSKQTISWDCRRGFRATCCAPVISAGCVCRCMSVFTNVHKSSYTFGELLYILKDSDSNFLSITICAIGISHHSLLDYELKTPIFLKVKQCVLFCLIFKDELLF